MANEFIEVTAEATGLKQWIPAKWLDHPILRRGFASTPSQRAAAAASTPPDESSKVADIEAYAKANAIDLAGTSTKAEKLAAIEAAANEPVPTGDAFVDTPSSDPTTTSNDNTPED